MVIVVGGSKQVSFVGRSKHRQVSSKPVAIVIQQFKSATSGLVEERGTIRRQITRKRGKFPTVGLCDQRLEWRIYHAIKYAGAEYPVRWCGHRQRWELVLASSEPVLLDKR